MVFRRKHFIRTETAGTSIYRYHVLTHMDTIHTREVHNFKKYVAHSKGLERFLP
jgi:hypothetical protein